MIDSLGRYQLSDMRDRVRRLLSQVQFAVDPVTGAESALVITDSNISNTDIVNQLNSSLMATFIDLCQDTPQIYTKTVPIESGINNRVVGLPAGTYQVNLIEWLSNSNITPQAAQNSDWVPMYEYDEDNSIRPSGDWAPTWRREDDTIVLSWDEQRLTVPRFMRVRGVFLPPGFIITGNAAVDDIQVVTTSLARVIQEFIIYDSAFVLADTKNMKVPQLVAKGREEWNERLKRAAENMNHPRFMQMRSNRMIKNSYTGR